MIDGPDADVERRIERLEELRDSLGRDAPHTMIGFLNGEMDRLRLVKLGAARRAPDAPDDDC